MGGSVNWWLIGLGSLLGGCARALLSTPLALPVTPGLPVGTLLVNVTGGFAIGLYASLRGPGSPRQGGPGEQQFVMAGVCGGYTTFSIFSLESLTLLTAGPLTLALCWIGLSATLWLLATWLGLRAGELAT
jgi:CrcB protein